MAETTASYFDAKAKNWDADQVKIARARAVADGIRKNVPLTRPLTGIEYGCGTGLLSFELQPSLSQITLADNSEGMLTVLREKIAAGGVTNMQPIKVDFANDPLPTQRFGLVYSLMTLHHIPDTDKALRDSYQLLDSPGYLCIADLDSEDGSFHGAGFDGHNGFDRDDLGHRAAQAGFCNVRFETVFHMSKGNGPGQTEFSLFLMTAEKATG